MKRPWRAHFTRDWALDPFVRDLSLEARCVYSELLDIAWDEGGLRLEWIATGQHVAQRIGITRRKFVSIWPSIRDKFEEYSPGFWSNSRLEKERILADEYAEKQSNRAKLRYSKSAAAVQGAQASGSAFTITTQSHTQSPKELVPAKPEPLPFKPDAAIAALAAGGRFTALKLNKGQAINATRLIREYPTLGTWKLVGEWLAAGGESWRQHVDVRALSDMTAWVEHAKAWDAQGRPLVLTNGTMKQRKHAEPSAGPSEPENQSELLR